MANWVYAVNIVQFLLGAIISIVNLILWIAIVINPNLREAKYCLMANMWFVNLLLGIIVAISNVVDQAGIYVFEKTEGTVAIVNGFVTVSMLLTMTTNRVLIIRNPSKAMSTKTSFRIIIATWIAVLIMTFIKAIVFGLSQVGTVDSCIKCFLGFEVSTLVIFAAATLVVFFISIYFICSRRNRAVGDSSSTTNINTTLTLTSDHIQKEYTNMITIGLLLFGFSVTFLAFVFLIPAWLTNRNSVTPDASEIIITLFYTHCLINPIIVLIRDDELRKSAKTVLRCKRPAQRNETRQVQQVASNSLDNVRNRQAENLETRNEQSSDRQVVQVHAPPQQKPTVQLPPIENPTTKTQLVSPEVVEEAKQASDNPIVDNQTAPTAPPVTELGEPNWENQFEERLQTLYDK